MILPIAFTASDSERPQTSLILYRAGRPEQNDTSDIETVAAELRTRIWSATAPTTTGCPPRNSS
jgi:hypothetical protein